MAKGEPPAVPTETTADAARPNATGDADALWDLAETVARALDGAEGALPQKLARLLAAQREVEARETALVDAHLALLAERNLYMRRLVEVERFVQSAPPPTADADRQLLGVVGAVLYGAAGSSPAGGPPAPG